MSSKLVLYFIDPSPPSRAVYLLAKYLEIDFELKRVDLLSGEQFSEEFLKLNPLHQVPVLVDGDFVLNESRAIMAYLVNTRKPGSDLIPSDPKERALMNQRLYYDATIGFKALSDFVRPALYFGGTKIVQKQRDDIRKVLNNLNSFLDGREYFAGKNLTIADISILPTVTSFAEFGYDLAAYPNLKKWHENLQTLPSFDLNLEGAKILADLLRKGYDDQLY